MHSNLKHICFDLDGTLVDSHKTIYNATIKSLKDLNILNNINEDIFREKIGMHFVDIFEDMNIPVNDFEEFIQVYKNNYFLFIDDSELYPEVSNILSYFSKSEYKISLLTTKAQDQAEKILEHFNLSKYFDLIMGRRNGIAHKPSPEPLLLICEELIVNSDESLIVGDTEMDILCGQNANTKTCAVTHGYRTEESILKHKPDYIVKDLNALKRLFEI
jgi:phosphoglycolate phosphatase-like HAD superfamily hydrolase